MNEKINNTDKFHILIVEDDLNQRNLQKEILDNNDKYHFTEAENGSEAISLIKQQDFDVVLLDRRLPDISGDEVCEIIRKDLKNNFLPIIMVTGDDPGIVMQKMMDGSLTNDYIRKPYMPIELLARVKTAINLKRKTDQLDNVESILYSLASMVEAKDGETGDHCNRLAHICTIFGRELGLPENNIKSLQRAGVLHDIGKIAVPDAVLLKNGPLTDQEWEFMKLHPERGYDLCKSLRSLHPVLPIIQYHHEKFDGSGYPYELKGKDIPLLARVFQIVDIYDALSHERVYKKALPLNKVIEILEQETARGWRDPELVKIFIHLLNTRLDDFNDSKDKMFTQNYLDFSNLTMPPAIAADIKKAS